MQFLCSARQWTNILWIPDCERLQLLRINCQTMNHAQKWRQVNEQTKQVQDKDFKIIPHVVTKLIWK